MTSTRAEVVPLSLNRTNRPKRANRTGAEVLDAVRAWFARFIVVSSPGDLDVLALWAVHTHLAEVLPTTPRLQIDSVMPGSGKTTALDHLARLARDPSMMAAVSSAALLARMLAERPRTLLIDEVDRVLDPKGELTGDLTAILNSGYKRGATRPTLVPVKGGDWKAVEMSTYAPVALAGNSPRLPDDTQSRCIRIVLMPDTAGLAEDSDWEELEAPAVQLRDRIATWAASVADQVRGLRPELPNGCRGRLREMWGPLKRVAVAAGGRWPAAVDELVLDALDEARLEREEGLQRVPPAVRILADLRTVFDGTGAEFLPTSEIVARLISEIPTEWSERSAYGRDLTAQRLGRMLVRGYRVHAIKEPDGARRRGYRRVQFEHAWRRMLAGPSGSLASDGSSGSGEGVI